MAPILLSILNLKKAQVKVTQYLLRISSSSRNSFLSIKKNKNIKGLNIFNHTFLNKTFFLNDKESLIEVMKVFDIFSSFSGLKLNKSKCEVTGSGAVKEPKQALCGMKCIDLRLNTIKVLGIHFSFNKKIENA